eukprot:TRINITY_DN17332_c0_g1_i2.p1 TRINITY_DN17332_c0_g1~~TRINITY_DN17332_c0_g1_i2.p1  ORF type:complete len:474 (-),score=29.89 TRINITY_DN17332_c0_g1_i2:44-1465(-)
MLARLNAARGGIRVVQWMFELLWVSGLAVAGGSLARLSRVGVVREKAELRKWKAYIQSVHERSRHVNESRGIVVIGGTSHRPGISSNSYTINALLAIAQLRRVGCMLPIELWHDNDTTLVGAYHEEVVLTLGHSSSRVKLRNFFDVLGGRHAKSYQLKTLALINSHFDEVLYIDADNILLKDPTPLFDWPEYRRTGAVFWPDFFMVNPWAKFWRMIDKRPEPTWTIEAGQMVLNLRRHVKPLALAHYFNQRGPARFYNWTHGDADLFVFAWQALGAPRSFAPALAIAGDLMNTLFCGHTILHFDPSKGVRLDAMFAHRSHDTLADSVGLSWRAIKRFPMLSLSPLVQAGLVGLNEWKEMLKIGDSDHGATKMTRVRDYGLGYYIRRHQDTSQCVCVDGVADSCWDIDASVEDTPRSRATVQRLANIEHELRRLLACLVDNSSSLRKQWFLEFAAHLAPFVSPSRDNSTRQYIH